MKPAATREVRRVLREHGCRLVGTTGSHEKWRTPGGLTAILVAQREQAPGVIRQMQRRFEPELGAQWLEEGLR